MHSTVSATVLLSVLATSALASPQYDYGTSSSNTVEAAAASVSGVHSVQVGPGLSFTPDTVTAAEGDWVEFTFGAGHSVAQSSFDAPCVPLASGAGVYSGFPSGGDVWRFQVNDTAPLWLYCSVSGHCEGGMSLVVNPPANNASRTLDAYKLASADATTESPDTPQGGVFGAASDSDSNSTSSTTGTGTATSSSTQTATGTSSGSTETGNVAPANLAASGMMFAGMVAAGVAAVL